MRLHRALSLLGLLTLGTVGLSQAIQLSFAMPPSTATSPSTATPPRTAAGGLRMTNPPTPPQEQHRPDGSRTVTTGHRYPDNVKTVTREYDPQGHLTTARIRWSGFAGELLDLTVTFGPGGSVVREEGFRAPEMNLSVAELLTDEPGTGT